MDTGKWAVIVWAVILAVIFDISKSASYFIAGFIAYLIGFFICYVVIKKLFRNSPNWGAVKWGLAIPFMALVLLIAAAFAYGFLAAYFTPATTQVLPPSQGSQPVIVPPAPPTVPETISPPASPPIPAVAGSGGSVDHTVEAMVYSGIDPPYALGNGDQIILTRNDKATNPTWAQLKAFMAQDQTDQITYRLGSFVCSNYAEQVYDNAEAHGIRAGFVAISFKDRSTPHALDAFETTDRGLVFIDSTQPVVSTVTVPGEKEFGVVTNYDNIGYVKIGQPYGIVSLSTNWGTSYPDYIAWQKALASFKTELANYNAEIERYNTRINAYNVNPTSEAEYYALKSEGAQLDQESTKIDSDGNRLGGFWDAPNDNVPVSQIEIYW
jgi:hypothetical protein